MVKLDATLLRYLTKDDIRVMTSVEMGMKNHELVTGNLVRSISGLKNANPNKILKQLTQHKLVSYERGKRYDGYRLTFMGYDYLALNVLSNRNVIANIGTQIGVGKESDVYLGSDGDGREYAIKLHRLGRTCFRNVTLKRDYQKYGHKRNWIYLSRLAALREYAFMKALYEKSFPIPKPYDCNRNCVVMQLINGTLMNQLTKNQVNDVPNLYNKLMDLLMTLANDLGLIHGDFNEFNIMLDNDTFEPIIIDFPQMISVSHASAEIYFERDVNCIVNFFAKRFGYESDRIPCFESVDVENDEKIQEFNLLFEDTKKDDPEFYGEKLINNDPDLHNDDQIDDDVHSDDDDDDGDDTVEAIDESVEQNQCSNIINENIIKFMDTLELTDERTDEKELIENKMIDNDEDSRFSIGKYASSTIASTFTPQEIKSTIKRERMKHDQRISRSANKNVKGDNSAVSRKRKDDHYTVKDDLKAYQLDGV